MWEKGLTVKRCDAAFLTGLSGLDAGNIGGVWECEAEVVRRGNRPWDWNPVDFTVVSRR